MNATETPICKPKVKICIISEDGSKEYYQVRSDKRIKKLLWTHCEYKNLDYNDMSFLFNGRRIKATQTPNELGMENGDEIDALHHQYGGVN